MPRYALITRNKAFKIGEDGTFSPSRNIALLARQIFPAEMLDVLSKLIGKLAKVSPITVASGAVIIAAPARNK